MVENVQDEDWTNVRMGLISGRPISFQMDLYQPLYVPRPVVEPELFASLQPPTYQGAIDGGVAGGGVRAPNTALRSGLKDAKGEGKSMDDAEAFGFRREADKKSALG